MERETNPRCKGMSVEEVCTKGTPTQKAYKVLMEYNDPRNEQKKTAITKDEAQSILDSLSDKDNQYYDVYEVYYRTYAENVIRTELFNECYKRHAETLKGMFTAIEVEELTLTQVYKNIPPSAREKIFSSPNLSVDVVECEGGVRLFFKRESRDWWTRIETERDKVWEALSDLKNLFYAFDKFDRGFKKQVNGVALDTLRLFRPRLIRNIIKAVKEDYVATDLPMMSKKKLHEKIKKGEYVGPYDTERAIFPYYEEVPKDQKEINIWYALMVQSSYSILKRMINK